MKFSAWENNDGNSCHRQYSGKTEFIEEVKAALHQIIEPSREEKGNLQYDLHTESEQKGLLSFRTLGFR